MATSGDQRATESIGYPVCFCKNGEKQARVCVTDDEVLVSAVSAWEIAIKASLGKVRSDRTLAELCADPGFVELPVLMRHTEALSRGDDEGVNGTPFTKASQRRDRPYELADTFYPTFLGSGTWPVSVR